jgi:hypothetical protein
LINNRQSGRRRGRGGGGGGGGGGNNGPRQGRADNGNRIDNRARGNAAQLLEKYKNLASDAQRQGDRVNTEYYLQFADHYFRVLSDQRGRFDDQQPRRQRDDFDGDGDEEFGDEGEPIRAGEQLEPRRERAERQDRSQDRAERDRPERGERQDRGDRNERRARREEPQAGAEIAGQHRADALTPGEALEARAEQVLERDAPLEAPRRRGRPRRVVEEQAEPVEALDAERLPPSLITPANDADGEEAAPKPRRRRTRGPAAEVPSAAE